MSDNLPTNDKQEQEVACENVAEDFCDTWSEETKSEDSQSEETLEDVQQKYNALNDKYVRVYSDFENTKKRLEKDKYSAIDFALERFAGDLLEVIDTLSLALKANESSESSAEDMLKNLIEGVGLTSQKLEKVFEKYDITKIESSGEFDPNFHNAISKVPSDDCESGKIVQVFQEGYKIKDRVLRASMVSIAE